MKSSTKISILALLLVGIGITIASLIRTSSPSPYPEASFRSGAVHPAGLFVNAVKSGDYYREQITRNPDIVENYTKLGQLQLQLARETGNELRYVPEARRLIAQALTLNPDDYSARVLDATTLNTLHRFDEARDKLASLIRENPRSAYLRGAMVDALIELGEYEEAVSQSDTMQSLKPGLSSYARAGYLRELYGQDESALEALRMAANAGTVGSADRSSVLFQLGKLHLKMCHADTATAIFETILSEDPNYNIALAGLASVALAERRFEDALDLSRNGFAATQRTVFLEISQGATAAAGLPADSLTLDTIHNSFRDAQKIGENVDMEYADFLADHDLRLEEAYERILREVRRRPNHLHTIETHAWTLHKLGRSAEALPIIERAMRLGTNDAMLYFRASQIASGANEMHKSGLLLQKALLLNLHCEGRGGISDRG